MKSVDGHISLFKLWGPSLEWTLQKFWGTHASTAGGLQTVFNQHFDTFRFHLINYVTAPSAKMKNTVHLGDFYTSELLGAVASLMEVKPTG